LQLHRMISITSNSIKASAPETNQPSNKLSPINKNIERPSSNFRNEMSLWDR